MESFTDCSEDTNDDRYKYNFFTIPQTLDLFFLITIVIIIIIIIIIIVVVVVVVVIIIIIIIFIFFSLIYTIIQRNSRALSEPARACS